MAFSLLVFTDNLRREKCILSEANDIIKNLSEREFRSFGATALFANLKWWANEENDKCNPETLEKAIMILDDIILNEYKDDFLVKVFKGDVFYRARTVSIDDYGNIEKGIYSSKTRLHGYDWKESKEPPAKYAAAGRNSKQKERALYMASNEITACAEVRPPIRALVSIAKFIELTSMELYGLKDGIVGKLKQLVNDH